MDTNRSRSDETVKRAGLFEARMRTADVMTRRLGNGLPSTLTPERIRGVLKFARSQEKEFREILDSDDALAWRQANSSKGLYDRLHGLLRTVDGRRAYETARGDFERPKRKRLGRADLLVHLWKDVSRTLFGASESVSIQTDKYQLNISDLIEQSEAWDHIAEYLWLWCVLRERNDDVAAGDVIVENLDRYPNLEPYLEEVRKGLDTASALIDDIRSIVDDLDAERLDKEALDELHRRVQALSAIAETTERERHEVERLRSLISDWRERRTDEIEKSEKIGEYVSKIEALVEIGKMDRPSVDGILSLFGDAFAAESSYERTRSRIAQATDEEDYASVGQLADASKSRKNERDAVYTSIDMKLSRVSGVEEPKAAERETETIPEPESDEEASEGDSFVKPEDDTDRKEVLDTRPDIEETERASIDSVSVARIDSVSVARIEAGIATAIERHRFALAYHLARAEPKALPSANAVKLVACNYATDDLTAVSAELPNLADALLQEARTVLDGESGRKPLRGYAVLLASAALAPALVAPGGPVSQLLSDLEPRLGDDMPSLRALAKATADFSMLGFNFPAGLLREGDSLEKWKKEEGAIQREVESWIENNQCARIRYQRATVVWKRMLEVWEDGKKDDRSSIGWIFKELKEKRGDFGLVSRRINHWHDNGIGEIDRIDREKYRRQEKIEGSARKDLRNKISEAVNLADQWCRLIQGRPAGESEFQERKARALRNVVRREASRTIGEIDQLATPTARAAGELISVYASMFEESASEKPSPTMRLPDLLNGWLLLDPDIHFDESDGSPATSLDIGRLIDFVDIESPDFLSAAIVRARNGDFGGASAAVDFAQRSELFDDKDGGSIHRLIEEERERALRRIRGRISNTEERLDDAYARGVVSLETFEQLRDDLPSIDPPDIDEIGLLNEALDHVDEEIGKAKQEAGERQRQSLAKLDNVSPEDKKRIQSAIEEQPPSVAEDYIERVRRGEGLPEVETETSRPFDDFFPKFVDDYVSLRDGQSDAFERVRQDAVHDGSRLLDQWSNLRARKIARDVLEVLFAAIGFTQTEVRPLKDSKVWMLKSGPVSDRSVCRLADFGSRAQGRYRLIVIEGYTTEEKIIQEVVEEFWNGGPPNIVLFLNVLDTNARRALALGLGSERCRPTLVLDEALAVFLAARPRGRLTAFFDCASAFTFAQPFDPDAAEVPLEMFFGRDSERQAVLAISGSTEMTHLVYGGRRLGKTALLANIARTCEAEKPNWVVSLINLKGTGIGAIKTTDELWREIATPLSGCGIVKPETIRPRSIEDGVCKWLDGDPDRRILLLIDEADDFLEADGDERYRVLEEIKHLMDRTERRFKVVFAGLHNVQRAARDPNTPFAHLGESIQIGPMLPETDPEKIENLIRDPLEALGYRFASVDSVIRIAAETNYYPALAQQFCKELLRDLRDNWHTRGETGPPYTIHPEIVDRILDSKETRERIRNLFMWTIRLDRRYEFLVYLIAQHSFDNGSVRLRSVPIDDIRQSALKEWPAGFESDSTFLTFQVLLEEMVGLGILRRVGDKEDYAIRTRNLRMLLGNDDEIERRLSDSIDKLPPPRFDSGLFRNTLNDGAPSPLTASQETQILSGRRVVGLVFGATLGDLDRVGGALIKAGENKSVIINMHPAVSADMDDKLKEISRGRAPGIDIVLIDARADWKLELIDRAASFVARLDSRKRTIRPVFLLGPVEAWAWLEETTWRDNKRSSVNIPDVRVQEIWLAPCAKDFTRKWLTDREAPACAELEKPDRPIDPLWPAVARAAAEGNEGKPKSVANAIDAALSGGDLVSDILVGSETKTALSVLLQFPDDSMTADDLCDFASEGDFISPETALRVFDWGSRLGILHSGERGYRLDSTYAAGLKTVLEE